MPLLRPRLDRCPRLGELRQALLPSRQFLGDRHPVRHLRLIRRLGAGHEFGHLGLQPCLDLARVLVRQRAVAAGVGVDLGPIERHRAHLQHAHLARQHQHLDKELLDLLKKAPPKRGDRVVVGMLVGRDEAERHRVKGRALELAARKHPCRIAVDQNAEQKAGVVGRFPRATVAAGHRPQIQPRDHLHHEPRQVPLRKPLVHRRRHQKSAVTVDRAEVAHAEEVRAGGVNQCPDSNAGLRVALNPTGC